MRDHGSRTSIEAPAHPSSLLARCHRVSWRSSHSFGRCKRWDRTRCLREVPIRLLFGSIGCSVDIEVHPNPVIAGSTTSIDAEPSSLYTRFVSPTSPSLTALRTRVHHVVLLLPMHHQLVGLNSLELSARASRGSRRRCGGRHRRGGGRRRRRRSTRRGRRRRRRRRGRRRRGLPNRDDARIDPRRRHLVPDLKRGRLAASRCAHEVRHALNVDRRAEVGLEPALARRARLRAEESLAAARAHLDPLHAACAAAPLVRRGARLLRVHGLGAAGCARSRGAVKQWRAGWLAATGGGEGGGGGGEVGAPSA